nr:MAG TPA: putative nucleotidyltransferase [Caudoviricetes sp.]
MYVIHKCVVGSRLHGTATENSDWDFRGIHISPLVEHISPFKKVKNTSWIEGDMDNTSYELASFCKDITKGNATLLEVLFSSQVIKSSDISLEMIDNWKMFFDTDNFIKASTGYCSNQYRKFALYEDKGQSGQARTAKFIIAFIRVMWQCEQMLLTGVFNPTLEYCDKLDYIKSIKELPREEISVPEAFTHIEDMNRRVIEAQMNIHPSIKGNKPNIEYIEDFIMRSYLD